jgi:hypothetical protein
MLEGHAALAAFVKAGNRIKYDTYRMSAIKDALNDADLPELSVVPYGGLPHLRRSSGGTSFLERYECRLVTGSQMLGRVGGFLPIKWEVYRAFVDWDDYLKALTWQGESFVVQTKLDEVTDDMLNTELTLDRGFIGWVGLIRFNVEMWFRTADLVTP